MLVDHSSPLFTPVDWTIGPADRAAAKGVKLAPLDPATVSLWTDPEAVPLPLSHAARRVLADRARSTLWLREDTAAAVARAYQPPRERVTANPRPGIITRRDRRDLTTGFGGMARG